MRKPLILTLACGLALLTAACETYPPPPPPVSPAVARENHVRWCYDNHGGYDPRSNVYVGSDGSPHYCVTPWER